MSEDWDKDLTMNDNMSTMFDSRYYNEDDSIEKNRKFLNRKIVITFKPNELFDLLKSYEDHNTFDKCFGIIYNNVYTKYNNFLESRIDLYTSVRQKCLKEKYTIIFEKDNIDIKAADFIQQLCNINYYYNYLTKAQQETFNKSLYYYVVYNMDRNSLRYAALDDRFLTAAENDIFFKYLVKTVSKLNIECNTIALNNIMNNAVEVSRLYMESNNE